MPYVRARLLGGASRRTLFGSVLGLGAFCAEQLGTSQLSEVRRSA